MKTYLITGGAGFIGSTLADKLLKEGNKVVVIDNFNDYYDPKLKEKNIKHNLEKENYKLYRVDILEKQKIMDIFNENKINTVIHLAAMAGVRPSIENPLLYQEVNCVGAQNIFEAMRETNVLNIVFASSSSVYGNNKKTPFAETDVVDYAISPYAATKKANEVMGHVYHSLYGVSAAFLRFFTVYGPRQRPDLAINKFTRLIMNEEEIPFYGDGETSRDYTYIEDIVSGILKSIEYVEHNDNVYEVINIGSNNPITLKDMVKGIELAVGKTAKIKKLPMQPGDVDITYADITKARKLLGYEPTINYNDGVKNFVEWYLEEK